MLFSLQVTFATNVEESQDKARDPEGVEACLGPTRDCEDPVATNGRGLVQEVSVWLLCGNICELEMALLRLGQCGSQSLIR